MLSSRVRFAVPALMVVMATACGSSDGQSVRTPTAPTGAATTVPVRNEPPPGVSPVMTDPPEPQLTTPPRS